MVRRWLLLVHSIPSWLVRNQVYGAFWSTLMAHAFCLDQVPIKRTKKYCHTVWKKSTSMLPAFQNKERLRPLQTF